MLPVRDDRRKALIKVLERPRYEVIPLEGIEDEVVARVPTDVKLTVTASPARGIAPTLDTTERLREAGFDVVPHLAARLIADTAQLKDILQQMSDLDIRDVFVVAGDPKRPAGEFDGALELIRAMEVIGHDLSEIGITGYTESHPFIDDDVTIQSMWDKRHFATYIVSNICFDPKVIRAWVQRVRRRGVALPIHIGMPGDTDRSRLLRISTKIGVGDSTRFLVRHRHWFLRLFFPGGYSPDRMVRRLAELFQDEAKKVLGLHVYTFNEVGRTERWRREMLQRLETDASGRASQPKELRK